MRGILILLALLTLTKGKRIPEGIELNEYKLHLKFTDDTFTRSPYLYEGSLEIRFALRNSYPSDLMLHAAADFITWKSAAMNSSSVMTNVTRFVVEDADNDLLMLLDTERAKATLYYSYLYINYSSRLSIDDLYGLYRTTFVSDNEASLLVASQFEPTFARRVFPCLDEPTFKTTIKLTVTHPSDKIVYFNTAEENSTSTNGVTTTVFSPTGNMAPYMAGLIIANRNHFTCSLGQNFTYGTVDYYQVCSRASTGDARAWALEIGPLLMSELSNMTNYGYGLRMGFPKMDLIALPNAPAKATENWGIITFREQDLLFDETDSSTLDKQNIAETVTFEFAQMWFGNMVSSEWWNFNYFTKGLACYLQYLVTDRVFKDWHLQQYFVNRVLQPAMELDSLKHSPSLRTGANNTDEIIATFDQIFVLKGAALFRMLNEAIAGYDNFRQGLEYFLTTYSYRNTEPQGLWNQLSALINLDNPELLPGPMYLRDVLINWEVSPGFPLLAVNRSDDDVVYVMQQGRFLYSGLDKSYEWCVPVSYAFSSDVTAFSNTTLTQYSLPNSTLEIKLPSHEEKWVILNVQAAGYYRVHYNDMWQNISMALHEPNFAGIPELNRAQLLDDAFALARANLLSYSFVFDFLDYLADEEGLTPWLTALNGVDFILQKVGQASSLGIKIEGRIFGYFSKIYNTVPWSVVDEEDHVYSVRQIELLRAICELGYLDCVKHANDHFARLQNTGIRPHKNLRDAVYCSALLYGGDTKKWNVLYDAYKATNSASEKVRILSALGCAANEALLKKSLALTLDESSGIASQDVSLVFTSVYSHSKIGPRVAMEFLINNYQVVVKRYQGMNTLRDMILGLAKYLTESSEITRLKRFLLNTDNVEIKSVAEQASEIMDLNVQWLDDHLDELKRYFAVAAEGEASTDDSVPSSGVKTSSMATTTQESEEASVHSGANPLATSFLLRWLS